MSRSELKMKNEKLKIVLIALTILQIAHIYLPLLGQADWYTSRLSPWTTIADLSYLNEKPAGQHGFLSTHMYLPTIPKSAFGELRSAEEPVFLTKRMHL